MPYGLTKSHFSLILQKDVTTGNVVDREGVALVAVVEDGVEKVQKCSAAGSEFPIGFAISDNESIATDIEVEEFTIPAAPGPYTVQLAHTTPVNGGGATVEAACIVIATGVAKVRQANPGAVDADAKFYVSATGLCTFNSASAGQIVRVTYRWSMTVAESRLKYHQRNSANEAGAEFNSVAVGCGVGEIETYEFDAGIDWNQASPACVCGADGKVTVGGGGTALPVRVIKVPSVNSPTLGLAFNFTA